VRRSALTLTGASLTPTVHTFNCAMPSCCVVNPVMAPHAVKCAHVWPVLSLRGSVRVRL